MFGFDDILGAANFAAGLFGGMDTNSTNQDIASANNATSVYLSTHAHQNEVADLQAAGLNPMLSYFGKGSQVPNLTSPVMQNPVDAANRSLATASQYKQQSAEVENLKEQVGTQRTQQVMNQANALKATKEADLAQASADEVRARTPGHILNQSLTQEQINVTRATVDKVIADKYLTVEETNRVQFEIANAIKQGRLIDANTGNVKVDSALKQAEILLKGAQVTLTNTESRKNQVQTGLEVMRYPEAQAESDFYSTTFGHDYAPYLHSANEVATGAGLGLGAISFLRKRPGTVINNTTTNVKHFAPKGH